MGTKAAAEPTASGRIYRTLRRSRWARQLRAARRRAAGWVVRLRAAVRRLPRWVRLPVRTVLYLALAVAVLAAIPFAWTQIAAGGHLYNEADLTDPARGPRADVVLVLGAQIEPDRITPRPFLRGRLDTAAGLIKSGRARVVLVSGDAGGTSGDEPAAMRNYLIGIGIDPARIIEDGAGLDTYDSCLRARQVFGVTRLIVVTQPYHLARAVALCRHVGVEADGVGSGCGGCSLFPDLAPKIVRDYFACTKAAWDASRDRPPAVSSPPSTAVADALH